jgi:hypothetical protein
MFVAAIMAVVRFASPSESTARRFRQQDCGRTSRQRKAFVARAEEKLTALRELEAAIQLSLKSPSLVSPLNTRSRYHQVFSSLVSASHFATNG